MALIGRNSIAKDCDNLRPLVAVARCFYAGRQEGSFRICIHPVRRFPDGRNRALGLAGSSGALARFVVDKAIVHAGNGYEFEGVNS